MEMMEEMEERTRRIVATAVELAEEGGFEAVRLRDVAADAGVVGLSKLFNTLKKKVSPFYPGGWLSNAAVANRRRGGPRSRRIRPEMRADQGSS